MNRRHLLASLLCVVLAGALPAAAQVGAKIGVVNTAKVFADMAETKALTEKMNAERQKFLDEDKQRRDELESLRASLKDLKRDSAQYRETEERMFEGAVKYKAWAELVQAKVQREQKVKIKALFDKIEAAVAEVAANKKLDIVLALQKPEVPDNLDQMPVAELQNRLNQRNILYVNPDRERGLDISSDVVMVLDHNYKAPPAGK